MTVRRQLVSLQQVAEDRDSIYEYLSGRAVEVCPCTSGKVATQQVYVFKTYKIHKQDYLSVVVRSWEDIENVKEHVNQQYGCYLVPVLHQVREDEEEKVIAELNKYFKSLIQHRVVRGDQQLFRFLFIQESIQPEKSKYDRFLGRLVDLSRQYLNKMLTREESPGRVEEEEAMQQYKLEFLQEQQNFLNFSKIINIFTNEHIAYYNIVISCDDYLFQEKHRQRLLMEKVNNTHDKSQKLLSTFQQISQAFRLRYLLKEYIKELKANTIRSKYNSSYTQADKMLQESQKKYAAWTEQLLGEFQSSLTLVRSLVRQLSEEYYGIKQLMYKI